MDNNTDNIDGSSAIKRVKFLGNYSTRAWLRQFPDNRPYWGACEFIFDPDERDYDWLVVYNDMPGEHQEEVLSCPASHTMLITMEPHTIKSYGRAYPNQFGCVLTSQPPWALPHSNRIFSQCALQWFYGCGREHLRTYDSMIKAPQLEKGKDISTVCSNKRQRHTLHNRRYEFTQKLKTIIPEMEIFGHGVREMDDKAEALDGYRYHLAIENYIGKHHWTEKLADVFLGVALPFYSGCTNAADYFPEKSFIPIDIDDVDGTSEIIKKAIRDNEYEKRLPHILEARRMVLEQYNMFAVLDQYIGSQKVFVENDLGRPAIMSRRLLRKKNSLVSVWDVVEKGRLKLLQTVKMSQ